MIEFILNNKHIKTAESPGMVLLDFIRYHQGLKGTKIGCREGDCGACTVLSGSLNKDGITEYESIVSCLTPLGNVHGKHIVTIEGINREKGNPVQEIFVKENATQCGFCTPGFIMSLTAFSITGNYRKENALAAVSGNICRCTGYKSIDRAIDEIISVLNALPDGNKIQRLIDNGFLPLYFKDIPARLKKIQSKAEETQGKIVAGGTDLYVQQADSLQDEKLRFIKKKNNPVKISKNTCIIDATCTVTDLENSELLTPVFKKSGNIFKLISSKQIRNMATLGGNFVNASPIADLSIIFIALNAKLNIQNKTGNTRKIKLKDFFKAYKQVDLQKDELIESLEFEIPQNPVYFNFEKVSKRTHLDIASVNTAISLQLEGDCIKEIYISAGGVAPVPLLLEKTEDFLLAKELNEENIARAGMLLQKEISPISDIRGSKEYKSLLLRQLFYKHFIALFPEKFKLKNILAHA